MQCCRQCSHRCIHYVHYAERPKQKERQTSTGSSPQGKETCCVSEGCTVLLKKKGSLTSQAETHLSQVTKDGTTEGLKEPLTKETWRKGKNNKASQGNGDLL